MPIEYETKDEKILRLKLENVKLKNKIVYLEAAITKIYESIKPFMPTDKGEK